MKSQLKWYATEEQKRIFNLEMESSSSFFARGGKVEVIGSKEASRSKKVDAQKLLDKVIGTKYEKEVIALLRKQGIQVENL
jgi:hypothetical protein